MWLYSAGTSISVERTGEDIPFTTTTRFLSVLLFPHWLIEQEDKLGAVTQSECSFQNMIAAFSLTHYFSCVDKVDSNRECSITLQQHQTDPHCVVSVGRQHHLLDTHTASLQSRFNHISTDWHTHTQWKYFQYLRNYRFSIQTYNNLSYVPHVVVWHLSLSLNKWSKEK